MNITNWGQVEGYRLLDADELLAGADPLPRGVEVLVSTFPHEWVPVVFGDAGCPTLNDSYRTKLTREELAAKRKIPISLKQDGWSGDVVITDTAKVVPQLSRSALFEMAYLVASKGNPSAEEHYSRMHIMVQLIDAALPSTVC